MTLIHWLNPVSADFSTAVDWSTGTVPGMNDDAILDAAGSTAYTVTVSTSETVGSVQTASTATLAITGGVFAAKAGTGSAANAGVIAVGDGSDFVIGVAPGGKGKIVFDNTGGITLNSGGSATVWELNSNTKLEGGGQITMSDNAANFISVATAGVTLTNEDNTISGSGIIGGGGMHFINEPDGVVDATGNTVALTIDTGPGDPGADTANDGLIEATGAAGLRILNTRLNNVGIIQAYEGSAVDLQSAFILDGAFKTVGTGAIHAVDEGTILDGSTSILENDGLFDIDNSAALTVQGTIANSGTINLNSGGDNTQLLMGAALDRAPGAVFTGGGQIVMSDNAANTITADAAADVLTNVDNTISGAGSLGGGLLTLVNDAAGVIDATGTNNALIIDTGGIAVTNAGLVEGTGSGGLVIEGAAVNGAGGTIRAGAGSSVALQASTVTGGTLSTAAGGTIAIGDGSSFSGGGAIANVGTIALESTGTPTSLAFDTNTTLTGGGTISMSANKKNTIQQIDTRIVLTNVDNTIAGSGAVAGKKMTLVNEAAGVIDADSNVALTVNIGTNTIINAGLIESTGAGKGTIVSAVDNTGTLEVAGKSLTFEGAVTGSGSAVVAAGILVFDSSFNENVAFTGQTGKLELAQSQAYGGDISGFSLAGLTSLHLGDVSFVSSTEATFNGTASGGVLTVTDGTHTAHITLVGDYTGATFVTSGDHHGKAIVVALGGPAGAPPHSFIAAAAGLGSSAGEAIHAGVARAELAQILARPHPMVA